MTPPPVVHEAGSTHDNKSSLVCSSCSSRNSCRSLSEESLCSHCSGHDHDHKEEPKKYEANKKKKPIQHHNHRPVAAPPPAPAPAPAAAIITVATGGAKSMTSTTNHDKSRNNYRKNTTSRMVVFCIFFLFVVGAITSFLCWPRTPRIYMGGGGVTSVNGEPPDWWAGERVPLSGQDNRVIPSRPSLRGTWQMNVTLDNRDNWIPTHLRSLDFVLLDSLTLSKFAWASVSSMVLQPGTISPISLTFNVNYQAPDNTDPTFQNLYNACGPLKTTDKQRPALKVLLKVI